MKNLIRVSRRGLSDALLLLASIAFLLSLLGGGQFALHLMISLAISVILLVGFFAFVIFAVSSIAWALNHRR